MNLDLRVPALVTVILPVRPAYHFYSYLVITILNVLIQNTALSYAENNPCSN